MSKTLGMRKEHLNSDEGVRTMSKTLGIRWLVVAAGAAMLLVLGAACTKEVEVPGETIIVEKEVVKTVEVPGETIVVEKEIIKTVEVEIPGKTVVVTKEVIKEVEVPGETVVVTKEVIKEVEVPGKTVVVTKEVLKVVEVRQGYVTDPSNGKVYVAPQYGGTLTYAYLHEPPNADMSIGGYGVAIAVSGVIEKLGHTNWAIDRSVNDLKTSFALIEHYTGAVAESWDISPDGLTYTFNIRKGVNWHNKAPMNGRELVAEDIVFNFHRYSGTGSGFTEPPPQAGRLAGMQYESITATDNYTVVFKLIEPPLDALRVLIDDIYAFMNAPEAIKQHGDVTDWRNLVGTGPFMMTDWVEGSSITYAKNPDYWGYDEKYPENRLPYVDQLIGLLMTEAATVVSALRTGKVDYNAHPNALLKTVDAADSLRKTNPEIRVSSLYNRANDTYAMVVTKPPFDDINVRKAMQMAVDLEAINNTYYKGFANATPQGQIANYQTGYTVPFEEWPEDVKKGYTYYPEGAEKLLDEAGYPRGADGIRFETGLDLMGSDVTYAEIVTAYLRDIGVEVKPVLNEWPEFFRRFTDGDTEGFAAFISAVPNPPLLALSFSYTRGLPNQYYNRGSVSDPHYDALVDAARVATSVEELQRLSSEADMYNISQHWYLMGPVPPWFNVTQPWVIGFDGGSMLGLQYQNAVFARLWIDQELKKAMGR